MTEKLHISIIQSDIIWLERKKNLKTYSELINKLKKTDIVFLPEMFDTGFYIEPHKLDISDKNMTLEWMKQLSEEKNISIGGSTIINENNKFYNRFLFVKPDNSIDFYDKHHLFKLAGELNEYSGGNTNTIINYDNWKIKIQICYDLRFPVWSRNTEDYHILVYVANWPSSRIKQWKSLLIARAIENQSYTFGINRIGVDGNGFEYSGKSIIIDPKGEIIYEAKKNQEDIYTAILNYENILKIRQKFPVLNDRDNFII